MIQVAKSLLYSLLDQIPASVSILELVDRDTMDFRYVYANSQKYKLVKSSPSDLIGSSLRGMFPSLYEGQSPFPQAALLALESQQVVDLGKEIYEDERLGTLVYDVRFIPLTSTQVTLFVKRVDNLSDLDETFQLKRLLFEEGEKIANLCTWIVHPAQGKMVYTDQFARVHGWNTLDITPDTVFSQKIAGIHAEDKDRMLAFYHQVHSTFPVSASYRFVTSGQEVIWLRDTLSRKIEGNRFMGTTQDITLEKEKEAELEQALALKQKIMFTSPEIIYVYSLVEQRNVFSNKSIFEELGYLPEDIVAMGDQFLAKTIHPEDLAAVYTHHGETLPNLKDLEVAKLAYRIKHNHTQEYVWLASSESVFERDEAGNVKTIVGIARNIHAEKVATEKIKAINLELEQFVYSVSHDLRAPVRHIESYGSLLRSIEGGQLSDEGQHMLNRVIIAAQRLGRMTDELLDYSRTRNVDPDISLINTEKLVSRLVEDFTQSNVDREIGWEIGPLPKCKADEQMMLQVWENLISNALKFSNNQSHILIQIRGEETETDVTYAIHDNGVGFDMKYANKLFTVFQRLHKKSQFEGNGIGLANVARIIALHGGKVWGEGKVGEGASFYFSIPKQYAHEPVKENPAS